MTTIKYIIHTLEKDSVALRYVPDEGDNSNGNIEFGGYARDLQLMKILASEAFGKTRFHTPAMTKRNKCWLSFRGTSSEFTAGLKSLEKRNMILEPVRGFGNLVR